jgi:beta-xylosidase
MHKKLLVAIATFLLSSSLVKIVAQQKSLQKWTADNGDGTYKNPLLWGDWPDPDIIRVDDDFYFISTSMHYVPGCPILHSRDLVNWEMAGYAVDHYTEDPRYDMHDGTLYLNGSWAATIRHHNGLFYVGFCTPYGIGIDKGHFSMCTAKNINGPWTRTIFPDYLYDPGLFFDDDGKVYVAHGQGTLYLTELNADALSVKSKPVKVWDKRFKADATLGGGFGLEGSHMYKINGKYYITCAGGGTEGWQICLRSDSLYGPYEHKVIVKDDCGYPGNGLHQGGLVQLKDGSWWFMIMQDRGAIGRVPHLESVEWKDGWPMIGEIGNGKGVAKYKKPIITKGSKIIPATTDEFDKPQLGLQWQWNHNPDNSLWSLTERKGYMRLHASLATDLTTARNTLTQRVQGPRSEATVEMDVTGLKDGDIAGFGIFESPYAYIAVRRLGTENTLIMVNNGKVIESIAHFSPKKLWLKSTATDKGFEGNFFYSVDGKKFSQFGNVLKMALGYDWTANRFALFNFSTTQNGVGGYVDFNWFRFQGVNE